MSNYHEQQVELRNPSKATSEYSSDDVFDQERFNSGYYNPIDETLQSDMRSTWVCGPTHNVQDQHIPGYTGHVHGMYSENLHGRPFSKLTADSLNGRVEAGFIINEDQRFRVNQKEDFCDPRRQKTLYTGTLEHKKTKQVYQVEPRLPDPCPPCDPVHISPFDRVPLVGYQGYAPTYMHPLRKIKKMEEMRTAYVSGSLIIDEAPTVDSEDLHVPIVGYTGFLPGKKARNVYAENYQQTAIDYEAKRVLESRCE